MQVILISPSTDGTGKDSMGPSGHLGALADFLRRGMAAMSSLGPQ